MSHSACEGQCRQQSGAEDRVKDRQVDDHRVGERTAGRDESYQAGQQHQAQAQEHPYPSPVSAQPVRVEPQQSEVRMASRRKGKMPSPRRRGRILSPRRGRRRDERQDTGQDDPAAGVVEVAFAVLHGISSNDALPTLPQNPSRGENHENLLSS